MAAVKAYKPETNSLSSGQVLQEPYSFKKARVVVMEMADAIALDLVDKRLVTDQLVLTISYDTESLNDPGVRSRYRGEITTDYYGRQAPKHAHGTANLERMTSSPTTKSWNARLPRSVRRWPKSERCRRLCSTSRRSSAKTLSSRVLAMRRGRRHERGINK